MKKFKKVNNDVKKTVEAYACYCSCDCGCSPLNGYPSEIGHNNARDAVSSNSRLVG